MILKKKAIAFGDYKIYTLLNFSVINEMMIHLKFSLFTIIFTKMKLDKLILQHIID